MDESYENHPAVCSRNSGHEEPLVMKLLIREIILYQYDRSALSAGLEYCKLVENRYARWDPGAADDNCRKAW